MKAPVVGIGLHRSILATRTTRVSSIAIQTAWKRKTLDVAADYLSVLSANNHQSNTPNIGAGFIALLLCFLPFIGLPLNTPYDIPLAVKFITFDQRPVLPEHSICPVTILVIKNSPDP